MRELKYIKIGKTLNDLEDVKQLWYGLEVGTSDEDYNEVYNGYSCENVLTYTQEPSRDLSGLLHNEDIQRFYIPTATFSFSYVNADIYSKLIQILNTEKFYVQYYDYEIMKDVIRDMYMTEHSLSRFHNVGADIKGFVDVEVTFVSRMSYETYDVLKEKVMYEEYTKVVFGTTGDLGQVSYDGIIRYQVATSLDIGLGYNDVTISDNHNINYDKSTGIANIKLYSLQPNSSVNAIVTYRKYVEAS